MKKESYSEFSPRADRVHKLTKKLERFHNLLRDSRYDNQTVLLSDLNIFLNTEKEIEIQKSYMQLEEMSWNN